MARPKNTAQKTIVFIDDSGDPGFKFDRMSSRYFVIAAVFCERSDDYKKAMHAISELKRLLNFKSTTEFKFRKARDDVRNKFLQAISTQQFHAVVAIIDKTRVTNCELAKNPSLFYNTVVLQVLKYICMKQTSIKVIVDGKLGRNYRRGTKTFLRQSLPKGYLVSFDYRDSKKDVFIQLADMVAGAAHFSKSASSKPNKYIKQIASHIDFITTKL